MIDLANEGDEEVIQFLIEHGADVRVHYTYIYKKCCSPEEFQITFVSESHFR